MSQKFTQIDYQVSEKIATITLNRPEKLNAFTNTMLHEIIAALDLSDADDDVRAVIFTGAGRAFCAGADLSMGGETFSRGGSDVAGVKDIPRDGGGLVSLRIFESKKPVIGAINGPAVGVGVTMTLPMDIRLCSDTAKFGFVFARRGIITEACSSWFLPRVVGISRATEWVFTGRMILADEAKESGLVRNVFESGELLAAARTLAREIPTTRGKNHDEQASVMIPRRAKTKPNLAVSLDRRISIGRVIVTPTPTAGPIIAPIIGFLLSKIRNETSPPPSRGISLTPATSLPPRLNVSPPIDKSAPAQNALPAPVKITARTSSSASLRSSAAMISCNIVFVNAFSFSGRLSVIVAIFSLTW